MQDVCNMIWNDVLIWIHKKTSVRGPEGMSLLCSKEEIQVSFQEVTRNFGSKLRPEIAGTVWRPALEERERRFILRPSKLEALVTVATE
jgi:hypothetical protein